MSIVWFFAGFYLGFFVMAFLQIGKEGDSIGPDNKRERNG